MEKRTGKPRLTSRGASLTRAPIYGAMNPQTAAPAASISYAVEGSGRTRLKATAVLDSSWPHVELTAVHGATRVTFTLSADEAMALAEGMAEAAGFMAAENGRPYRLPVTREALA